MHEYCNTFFEQNHALTPWKSYQNLRTDNYRYGFNGKEKDDEVSGSTGVTYDYGFRIYDSRIARFLSVDPLGGKYPWNSPYSYAEGDVIRSQDLDGLEKYIINQTYHDGKVIKISISRIIDTNGQARENNIMAHGVKITDKDVVTFNYNEDGTQYSPRTEQSDLTNRERRILKYGETTSQELYANKETANGTKSFTGFQNGDEFKNGSLLISSASISSFGFETGVNGTRTNKMINNGENPFAVLANFIEKYKGEGVIDALNITITPKKSTSMKIINNFTNQIRSKFPNADIKINFKGNLKDTDYVGPDGTKPHPDDFGIKVTGKKITK